MVRFLQDGYQGSAIPYHETFGYDQFSNPVARQSQTWNGQTDDSDAGTYTNNRRGGRGYDADGRNTAIDTRTNTFDAVGQQIAMNATAIALNGSSYTVNQADSYDGDGRMAKEVLLHLARTQAGGFFKGKEQRRSVKVHC